VFATRVVVPGTLVIGQDGLLAQVNLHQPALAVSTNVNVGPLGTLVSQVSQGIRSLSVAPGGHVVQDGAVNPILTTASLTMSAGDVDIRRGTISVTNVLFATSDSGQTALIHGAGFVITPLITTADGPQGVDLRISTRLINPLVIFGDFNAKFTTKKDGPGVLELAAIEYARLLVIASPDGFQVRRTLELARELNPRIAIVVRTHSASELAYLIAQGVDRAVMGELELALEMTDYALRSLGVSEERSKMVRQWLRTQEISRQK